MGKLDGQVELFRKGFKAGQRVLRLIHNCLSPQSSRFFRSLTYAFFTDLVRPFIGLFVNLFWSSLALLSRLIFRWDQREKRKDQTTALKLQSFLQCR